MIKDRQYREVSPNDVDCEEFLDDIIGYTDETFCGRPVILFRQRPGVFGSTSVKRPKLRRYTLHNGILNQCAVHSDNRPGVYWAVLDAMSDLRDGFTKEQVVDQAVETLKKYNGRFRGDARKSATTAFYILKTHRTHPARKNMGFGFIVEKVRGKVLRLRARQSDEQPEEKPLATVLVKERG